MSGIVNTLFGSKPKLPQPVQPPVVNNDPAASADKERLARVGRASLISTSAQGVLGNAQTGRKQLSI